MCATEESRLSLAGRGLTAGAMPARFAARRPPTRPWTGNAAEGFHRLPPRSPQRLEAEPEQGPWPRERAAHQHRRPVSSSDTVSALNELVPGLARGRAAQRTPSKHQYPRPLTMRAEPLPPDLSNYAWKPSSWESGWTRLSGKGARPSRGRSWPLASRGAASSARREVPPQGSARRAIRDAALLTAECCACFPSNQPGSPPVRRSFVRAEEHAQSEEGEESDARRRRRGADWMSARTKVFEAREAVLAVVHQLVVRVRHPEATLVARPRRWGIDPINGPDEGP